MSRRTYHPLAKFLHWTVFLLVAVAIVIGIVMVRRDYDPVTDLLFITHWSIGLTVLALMIARVVIRFAIAPPAPAAILKPWERRLSLMVHAGLYVMLFLVPILGWLGKSAFGASSAGIIVFGLFHVPVLIEQDDALAETLLGYHSAAVWIFLVLLALHIAGVIKHGLLARDGVVGRMGLGRTVAEPER